ncbi:MAG: crotonase/enoyl-CoA hydratase family protein [bacterium]|nr:crotonase/enoyl-CoA hydratase family protein [bacterium]
MRDELDILPFWGQYEQVKVRFEAPHRAVWYTLDPSERPCFNRDMLDELAHFHQCLIRVNKEAMAWGQCLPVRYTVIDSAVPGVFNLGGDLELFYGLISNKDGEGLFSYAKACIDVLFPNAVNFNLPLTTLSLVQGDALGGGFEAAISSNIVVAEESARFGLPEILFNLIPGMGAYSFLIRRTTPDVVERLITGGEILTAREMLDLKLVDEVVKDGEGASAVRNLLARHQRKGNAFSAFGRIRQCINPVTYDELIKITRIWVDTALQLGPRDLRMIENLIRAQDRRRSQIKLKKLEGQG